jgi:hypothetical protein
MLNRLADGAFLLASSLLLAPAAAAALSLSLAGPTSGPVTSGVGVENPSVGATIAFTVGLDASTAING